MPSTVETILTIDDEEVVRRLVAGALKRGDYQVRQASNAREGLRLAQEERIDLILCDVEMPQMDGLEALQRLKQDEATHEILVIMLTGVAKTDHKVAALSAGAVDYLTKPFQPKELLARVQTHLQIRSLRQELQQQNVRLEELVRQRTRELSEAHQRLEILDKAKTDFLNLISHELRTPLNGLLGVAQLLFMEAPPSAEVEELQNLFEVSQQRILAMLDDALFLTQVEVSSEAFSRSPTPLRPALCHAVDSVNALAESRQVLIGAVPEHEALVLCDAELLRTALARLLETAVKFTVAGQTVRISCERVAGKAVTRIQSAGRTIPEDILPKLFEVFAVTDPIAPGTDLGLGPPVAQRVISLFGGSVDVQNCEPEGVCFTVELELGSEDGSRRAAHS